MEITVIKGVGSERSYLVATSKGYILIDVGFPSTGRKILALTKNISLIVLTHRHYDHGGSAERVKKETGAKIAAGIKIGTGGNYLRLFRYLPHLGRSWLRNFYLPKFSDLRVKIKIQADIFLREGDFVDEAKNLQVISTPGHTPDSICLYNAKEKILFAGDTLVNVGNGPRWGALITDKSAFAATKKKLSKLRIDLVYPGHGEAFKIDSDLRKDFLFPPIKRDSI